MSEAVLTALAFYIERGGGSRGASAFAPRTAIARPKPAPGPLEDVRFVSERDEDRAEQIHVAFTRAKFVCEPRPIRGATATIGRSSSATGPTI